MQFHKFAGSFLVSAALLATTILSLISPAIANPRIIPSSFRQNAHSDLMGTSKGKIFDHSKKGNYVSCAGISVYIKKLLPDVSAQNIISTQAKGNYQKNGFCTYAYPIRLLSEPSSYIVVATYDQDSDYCKNGGYCDVKQLGEDLSMSIQLY